MSSIDEGVTRKRTGPEVMALKMTAAGTACLRWTAMTRSREVREPRSKTMA